EEIRIPSKADRRSIHGWILYPPDFDPNRRYPLALDIHGGPHLDYGPMFSLTHPLYAAAGYVVVFVNPRGSIGYGEEFATLIHLAYPGRDHDDLMSAVDSVLARGFIDPRRLYIGGGSGGGVLSSWAIGKTDRFAAASVTRPVIINIEDVRADTRSRRAGYELRGELVRGDSGAGLFDEQGNLVAMFFSRSVTRDVIYAIGDTEIAHVLSAPRALYSCDLEESRVVIR
ncbi:MAG: alpha/beta hydrolase family protein, partial [Ilumatobacteraceae bacterium]